jgi:hypothetical protein
MDRVLIITDWFSETSAEGQQNFHFSPEITLERIDMSGSSLKLSNRYGQAIVLFSLPGDNLNIYTSESWISESYGMRTAGKTVGFLVKPELTYKTVIVLPGNNDISKRIEAAQQLEAVSVGNRNVP